MGPGRAVVSRAVLGIGLLLGGACGAAGPVQSVAVRPTPTPTTAPAPPVTTAPTIDEGPAAAPALPGVEGGGLSGTGARVVRAAPGGPRVTGRIIIPKIGLDHVTYEGATLAQINYGPSHWPGTPMPGHVGNTVFPGHRTTHSRPFFDIDHLVPGDTITFVTAEGTFVYSVYESHIVRPTDTWVVDNTPDAIVTIFGCHPKGSARYRYVVRGRLTSAPIQPRPAPATAAPAKPQPAPSAPPTTHAPPPPTTAPPRKPNCVICL